MRTTGRGARVPRGLAGGVAAGRGDRMWHSRCVSATVIDNPILNSPFAEPARHWLLDDNGIPTGIPADGRRHAVAGAVKMGRKPKLPTISRLAAPPGAP